uniref:PAC2 family protein n=1 Tax=candidate division WOR-3 bacterium TaxID=2052148 RepID=A0A7C6E9E2_UNCW3
MNIKPPIHLTERIKLDQPVMFAAWPGMGNVALGAINYLRRNLAMHRFAQIDTNAFYSPEGIVVEDGLASIPPPPRSIFYFRREPDIIVLENDVQFGGASGVNFARTVIDFAQEMAVKRIFTGAAFPVPTSYRASVKLFGVANMKSGLDLLVRHRIKVMEEGSISGLNGLILGYAQEKGIESICILATMPVYATGFPNPRSWKALVEVFSQILNVNINFAELDTKIQQIDSRMEQIETHLQEMLGMKEREAPREEPTEEGISQYVLNKIERLFQEAKTNREKALELKRELDRWGLFEMYEDRFLDLFKKD